eukprot:TRINITY_DN36713_c0_g2_i1.p1 TRINITY_DN36713_c0_g2~~TRINITY_DN36713_c0_g2_i1.p1  ORF type:complete len:402 (+),score=90.08 TRINITY_DN36713_c0_g2_i1:163-1368(+)
MRVGHLRVLALWGFLQQLGAHGTLSPRLATSIDAGPARAAEQDLLQRAQKEAAELLTLAAQRGGRPTEPTRTGNLRADQRSYAQEAEALRTSNLLLVAQNSAMDRGNAELRQQLQSLQGNETLEDKLEDTFQVVQASVPNTVTDVFQSAAVIGFGGGVSAFMFGLSVLIFCQSLTPGQHKERVKMCGCIELTKATLSLVLMLIVFIVSGFWMLWTTHVIQAVLGEIAMYFLIMVLIAGCVCIGIVELFDGMNFIYDALQAISSTAHRVEVAIFGKKKKKKKSTLPGGLEVPGGLSSAAGFTDEDDDDSDSDDEKPGPVKEAAASAYARMSRFSQNVDNAFDRLMCGCGQRQAPPPRYVTETPHGVVTAPGARPPQQPGAASSPEEGQTQTRHMLDSTFRNM